MPVKEELELSLDDEEESEALETLPKKSRKSNPNHDGNIPKGYLSIGELAREHPTLGKVACENENAYVMVWLDQDVSLYAKIFSERAIKEIQARKEIPMLLNDLLQLIGDPRMRLDLPQPPPECPIDFMVVESMRRSCVENCLRTLQFRRSSEKKMACYSMKGTGHDEVDIHKINDDNDFWGKIPDFKVMVDMDFMQEGGQMQLKPKVSLLECVWNIMVENNISPTKKVWTQDDKVVVLDGLKTRAHVYGIEDELAGKNSLAHIQLKMEDAAIKFGGRGTR